MNFLSKKLNDFTRNSSKLKRPNGIKRLSNISNKSHTNQSIEISDEQQKAKNSWSIEDPIISKPEFSSSTKKNSWRRSNSNHSKTLTKRKSSNNNGNFNAQQEISKNELKSPLRKVASSSSSLSSQNQKVILLNWCKNILKRYVELEIINPINDFSKSWQNGVAFLSLIHSIRNDIVPEIEILIKPKGERNGKLKNNLFTPKHKSSLSNPSLSTAYKLFSAEPKDWYNNLERAFQLAEKYFKIVSKLDPNDIVWVKNPDERIIMTYITEFYMYIQEESNLAKDGMLLTPSSFDISETESNNNELQEMISKSRKRGNIYILCF